MLLIDRLPDTDVNIEELFEKELPCDIGSISKERNGEVLPWCEESADWACVIRCSECGGVKKILSCDGCRRFILYLLKLARVIMFFSSVKRCGHSARKQSFTFVKI
jgi:hypothetical protein